MSRIAVVSLAAACQIPSGAAEAPIADSVVASPVQVTAATERSLSTSADVPDATPVLTITDPAELAALKDVLDFGALFFDRPGATTKELRQTAGYRSLAASLRFDRGFPMWWVGHPRTRFALVGVVNRIDRRDFRPGTCGETRLIYRLSYRDDGETRLLPMTLNAVFVQPDDGAGCSEVARAWFVPQGEDLVEVLREHGRPLALVSLGRQRLLAIEANIREVEADGGVATNVLLVLDYDAGTDRFAAATLEFQPWSKTLLSSALVARWLGEEGTYDAIVRGIAKLPRQFDWDSAEVPVGGGVASPFGLMWMRGTLQPKVSLPQGGSLVNKERLTFRLDGMTCSGCHSRRSVAGFHLPGAGGLADGRSSHLLSELPFRERYLNALARGEAPPSVRPVPNDGPPGFGRHCSHALSPASGLVCDTGYSCVELGGPFGTCLPEDRDGSACVGGEDCSGTCARQSDCRDGWVCIAARTCEPAGSVRELRLAGHAKRLR